MSYNCYYLCLKRIYKLVKKYFYRPFSLGMIRVFLSSFYLKTSGFSQVTISTQILLIFWSFDYNVL